MLDLEMQLKNLGLSEKEAKVYLSLLSLGPSTAQQISQKAGVNRPTTYVQIETLTNKGLASSFEKGKKTFFVAEPPQSLTKLIEKEKSQLAEKEQILKNIFPGLNNLFEYAGEHPKVRFFEGKEGLKAIQEDFLKTKDKKIEAIFNRDVLEKVFSEKEEKTYFQRRTKKKIFIRSLYTRKEGRLNTLGPFTKRFWLPADKFPITSDITIYANKIAIVALEGKPIGVIIESKEMANTLRSVFNLAWQAAKKYNKPL